MKFRDLPIGARFEFKHVFSGMVRGPWIKTSPGKYRAEDGRFGGQEIRVGMISVQVIRLSPDERQDAL